MKLATACRLQNKSAIALVGAGGKTTALFRLAHELSPCIITSSTHLGAWQIDPSQSHIIYRPGSRQESFESIIGQGIVQVTGELEGDRYKGLDEEQLHTLKNLAGYHDIPLIIEADGARQRPLKAPADHEPAIPGFVDTVIVIAGLEALGKPLTDAYVHRSEIFSALSGLALGEIITDEAIADVLLHPLGGLKNIPVGAKRIVLLNQADSPEARSSARQIAAQLLPKYDSIVVSSLKSDATTDEKSDPIIAVHEETAGIILAAGNSRRFGSPKQLLKLHGRTFIRMVSEKGLTAGLHPIIVVTGAIHAEIRDELDDLPLNIINNPDWKDGQSTSIRTGLSNLSAKCGSATFLLADQPQVTPAVIRSLIDQHAIHLSPIVAPLIGGKRGNPVLFDRDTFTDLMDLKGDVGGRAIFHKYNPFYMDWADESLLVDVDTMEDYQNLLAWNHDA